MIDKKLFFYLSYKFGKYISIDSIITIIAIIILLWEKLNNLLSIKDG